MGNESTPDLVAVVAIAGTIRAHGRAHAGPVLIDGEDAEELVELGVARLATEEDGDAFSAAEVEAADLELERELEETGGHDPRVVEAIRSLLEDDGNRKPNARDVAKLVGRSVTAAERDDVLAWIEQD